MAKMIKDVVKFTCEKCNQDIVFAKIIKNWPDPKKKDDRPFRGIVRRCKCGTFDNNGKNVSSVVD